MCSLTLRASANERLEGGGQHANCFKRPPFLAKKSDYNGRMAVNTLDIDQVDATQGNRDRAIGIWLLSLCVCLFAMILIGGATRLTDSGLSITEWRPVTGAIPPLSDTAWQSEFEKYKQIPEYRYINKGMSLDEFKTIYWWEWGHRFFGRLIGILFLIPFLYFYFTKSIRPELLPKLIIMFVLGGLQGALGWYMVASGLTERVDVSQYRLAAHLGLAFIILGFIFWVALDLFRHTSPTRHPRFLHPDIAIARDGTIALTALIYIQIILGAFVAGLDAGLIYNTWPLMEGAFIPPDLFPMSPWIANFFEHRKLVQFDHRIVAYLVAIAGAVLWYRSRNAMLPVNARKAQNMMLAAIGLQILLGIWTLLAAVPIWLGLAHQAGAVFLFGAAVYACHTLAKPVRVSA